MSQKSSEKADTRNFLQPSIQVCSRCLNPLFQNQCAPAKCCSRFLSSFPRQRKITYPLRPGFFFWKSTPSRKWREGNCEHSSTISVFQLVSIDISTHHLLQSSSNTTAFLIHVTREKLTENGVIVSTFCLDCTKTLPFFLF